jgi:hypothetical protein
MTRPSTLFPSRPIYYALKSVLKLARWQSRRFGAAFKYGAAELARMPAVLGNAMPKSGSHLIIQVLQGLTHLGPFVNPGLPPVNRGEDNRKLPVETILANIQRMRPGDISYGYIAARTPYLSALVKPERATIFVYRDPRDMIISHVFYATQLHQGHGMHRYYTEVLHTMEQRINAAIQGVSVLGDDPAGEGASLSDVRTKYENYLGWLEQPAVLSLRFESLILDRQVALERILDYLAERGFTPQPPRSQAVAVLAQAIEPRRSGTFRKGKPGNWREHFTPANVTLFKERVGDLLIRLGYEKDNDW